MATNTREERAKKTKDAVDFKKLEVNENLILERHGEEDYESALNLLEESQRIIKTHYGTQSSEVSFILAILI